MTDYRGLTKCLFTFGDDEKSAQLNHLRERYARTSDRETLIEIIKLQEFPEARDTASALAEKKYRDMKGFRDIQWREIDRMYAFFTSADMNKTEFYDRILTIYFHANPDKGVKEVIEAHKNWAQKAYDALSEADQEKVRKNL